eukprot:scaffold13449_cov28-Tisochrysis_lutea.AAC.4
MIGVSCRTNERGAGGLAYGPLCTTSSVDPAPSTGTVLPPYASRSHRSGVGGGPDRFSMPGVRGEVSAPGETLEPHVKAAAGMAKEGGLSPHGAT